VRERQGAARAVLVGRPILWGLAVGGEAGVKSVLELLRKEFDVAMALSGCPRLTAITRDLVRPLSAAPPTSSAV
jgi:4-hydroxymandelate oxidase